jgi:glutamate dehydrogenase
MAQSVETAFPPQLRQRYNEAVHHHRLRAEIIATQLANDMVNTMGIVYIDRITQSTGADHGEIAKAYVTARDIFDLPYYWQQIESLDYRVASETQTALMIGLVHLIRRASRWFIRNRRSALDPAVELRHFRPQIERLVDELPRLIIGRALASWQHDSQQFIEAGVPEALASYVGSTAELYPLLGIIDAAREVEVDVLKVAEVFFTLAQKLEIDWLAQQITKLSVENHWQALAREAFRDDLEWQMRSLTITALKHVTQSCSTADCIDQWLDQHEALVGRWRSIVAELQGAEKQDFAMYSVAIRELLDMAQRSKYDEPNQAGCSVS